MVNRYYVHTGVIETDLGDLYNRLFERRNTADYNLRVEFDEAEVRPLISEARRFVERVAAGSMPLPAWRGPSPPFGGPAWYTPRSSALRRTFSHGSQTRHHARRREPYDRRYTDHAHLGTTD